MISTDYEYLLVLGILDEDDEATSNEDEDGIKTP